MPRLKENPNKLLGLKTEGTIARYAGHVANGVALGASARGEMIVRHAQKEQPKQQLVDALNAMLSQEDSFDEVSESRKRPGSKVSASYNGDAKILTLQISARDAEPLTVELGLHTEYTSQYAYRPEITAVAPVILDAKGARRSISEYPHRDQLDIYSVSTGALQELLHGRETGETTRVSQ